MPEHHGRAVDAAMLLRDRMEKLTSQLSELENLRVRVREAEQKVEREPKLVQNPCPPRPAIAVLT